MSTHAEAIVEQTGVGEFLRRFLRTRSAVLGLLLAATSSRG